MYRMRLGTHLGQCTGCVWGLTWPMYRMHLGTHLGQCTGCVWGLTWANVQDAFGDSLGPMYRMRLGTHLGQCTGCVWGLTWPNVQDAFGDSLGQCTGCIWGLTWASGTGCVWGLTWPMCSGHAGFTATCAELARLQSRCKQLLLCTQSNALLPITKTLLMVDIVYSRMVEIFNTLPPYCTLVTSLSDQAC